MKNTCKFVTGTISALIAVGSFANATTVIDFENEAPDGTTVFHGVRENPEPQDEAPNSYTVAGFTFAPTYRADDWYQFHATHPNQSMTIPVAAISDPDNGGAAMVGNPNSWFGFNNGEIPTLITITSESPTFSLYSIDLGPQNSGTQFEDEASYVIKAFNESGLVDTISFDPITTQTTIFTNPLLWKDLTRVEITGATNSERLGIDNVVFNMGTEAVPEPSSALLVGLAAFGFAVRRRRN